MKHHRFTVNEYRRMGEAAIFHQDDRVELIEGQIELPLHARHGIPEVWLVDLQDRQLFKFSGLAANCYQATETADTARPIPLPRLAGLTLDLAGLF